MTIKTGLLTIACSISLAAFPQKKAQESPIDLVCGKHVDPGESYDWKYAGKVYAFHSNECRLAFKMNPQNFLTRNCVADMIATDAVCGMKVNKLESYDSKYKGVKYHFCSYDCRETFRMVPQRFVNKKCAAADSTTK